MRSTSAPPSVHRSAAAFLKGAAGSTALAAGLEASWPPPRRLRPDLGGAPAPVGGLHPGGRRRAERLFTEYSAQNKVKVTLETISANDLQARITAAIQSGSGPDIILMLHNWPPLYAGGLADVSDLCEWKGRTRAATTRTRRPGPQRQRWLALPYSTGGSLIAYRRSWFAEVGANKPPTTLEYGRSGRSKRRASRSGRRSATPSGTRRRGPTRSCGPSAGPRPTRAARRSC